MVGLCETTLGPTRSSVPTQTSSRYRPPATMLKTDDLRIEAGRRHNQYSRLEMVIRPFSESQVLDLKGKATVMNRELFNRSHYVPVAEEFAAFQASLPPECVLCYDGVHPGSLGQYQIARSLLRRLGMGRKAGRGEFSQSGWRTHRQDAAYPR